MTPHDKTLSALFAELKTDEKSGLSSQEAAARLARDGENRLREGKKKTNLQRFAEQFKDVMILILLAAAVISFIVACSTGEPSEFFEPLLIVAIVIAILVYILMNKTTLGYELKACGANRHAARYAGISDKRNIVLSMAIAGALSGAGAALYYLAGNTEFYWVTYQSLPATGFNGIPVALLAANNAIGVIFTGLFMSMLDIAGLQLTGLTGYNEYITDVIIATIVYLSAFSLVIKMLITGRKKRKAIEAIPKLGYEPEEKKAADAPAEPAPEKGGEAE